MPRVSRPNPLRVLMLMDKDLVPPDSVEGLTPEQIKPYKMELDVAVALKGLGHEVMKLGLHDDLHELREALTTFKPQIAFNLLEGFSDFHCFDQNVVSFLELMHQSYTGCNP